MTWNWQKPDWPDFSWDEALLRKAEERFLLEAGMFVGAVKHLSPADQEQLVVEAMSLEAVTTSEIEGETLDRASVQSSIRKQLGFAADKVRIKPAEQGVAEMMVDLYRSFPDPLSHETLFAWHRMLTRGRRDLRYVGCYREDAEPMQVVSGALYSPRVHFEAPPSSEMPKEMARFVKWFNRTGPDGETSLPTLTRAGEDSTEGDRSFRREADHGSGRKPIRRRSEATLALRCCQDWSESSSEICPERSEGRVPLAEKGARGKGRSSFPHLSTAETMTGIAQRSETA
jgi:hypothetical protein